VSSEPKGYAAVITIDWAAPNVMWTIFEEEDGKPDPLHMAQGFRRSVIDDWPTHEHHIIANERARDLQADRILGPLLAEEPYRAL
jgi:hypothetical protein